MTCQECELALGLEQSDARLDEHLRECTECRELSIELRANAEAFASMATDKFAPVRVPVGRPVLSAAFAAAAAILLAIFAAFHFREQKLPPVHYTLGPMTLEIPQPPPPAPKRVRATQPLMVKMLTDDPNVVIYWQIDAEQEGQQEGMER